MLLGAFRPQTTTEDKKVTNSERSASQIYGVTPRLMARSRGNPEDAILPMPFELFRPPKPAPGGPATVFPCGREQELLASCYGWRSEGTAGTCRAFSGFSTLMLCIRARL